MDYQFKDIEKKWQKFWADNHTFKAENKSDKPKYYVLDMFPYPSGAGLHVGHPLGYIASDIFARYKRLKGFNVLHPMGYDSFGLPAEQYAIQTGQHPSVTTEANIATYRRQLDQIGFSFDWSREVRTSSPDYYKWTQWIFMQLFNSWYNKDADKAQPVSQLIAHFESNGSAGINAVCDEEILSFTANEWKAMTEQQQQAELLKYRLTYLRESTVNWCAALGTVLANDEVKDGFSERGGYPVEQKKMMQWSMRITAYAQRLLEGLDTIDWPEPLKEMQRNWIGKSVGASVKFPLASPKSSPKERISEDGAATSLSPGEGRGEAPKSSLKERTSEDGAATSLSPGEGRGEAPKYFPKERTYEDGASTSLSPGEGRGEAPKSPPKERTSEDGATTSLSFGEGRGEAPYIEVFTTRVDTIFGVSFLVIAPEHELVASLTTPEQQADIDAYITQTKKKSELDRMADTKTVSGAFTGSYVINPLNGSKVPVWIADYVLAGYGTGAVMAVPSGDQRDYLFAKHFNLPVISILDTQNIETEADPTKEGKYINSDFINGLGYKEATAAVVAKLEEIGLGKAKVNYRMRDAIFGRQRYWGEPVPVYFKDGLPYLIDESELPLVLPEIDKYLPTETGEPPLGRATGWSYTASPKSSPKERTFEDEAATSLSVGEGRGEATYAYELSTMPGWAGSSWYWYRYMDAHNNEDFAAKDAIEYWKAVDLYIGGSEHATGHLLYSRFWNKFLKDIGKVVEEEPFKKLINQGMIQGRSNFVYRLIKTKKFISYNKLQTLKSYIPVLSNVKFKDSEDTINRLLSSATLDYDSEVYNIFKENSDLTDTGVWDFKGYQLANVDVNIVNNDILDINKFKLWPPEYADAEFILENGKYICGVEVEKMSKSKFNVVNPDDLIERYGADTLRMYEMFLGPLEQSKPWNTNGIEGVFKFLRKFWRLFHDADWNFNVSDAEPTKAELKSLHKIIRKVEEDIERFSFNTSVSSFMIAVNELTDLKCNKRAILQDMVIILEPYAPHICEELWVLLENAPGTLSYAAYPKFNAAYLVEDEFSYPVSFNGKMKTNVSLSLTMEVKDIEAAILANADVQKYLDGKAPKKVIVVKGRIVNIVV